MTDSAREQMRAALAPYREKMEGRVSKPENWHLTLDFLGMVGAEKAKELIQKMNAADMGRAFEITLGGFGAFPSLKRAKVFWAGVAGGMEPIQDLAEKVISVCESAGFPREKDKYVPHLTVFRPKAPRNLEILAREMVIEPVKLEAGTVALFESVSTPHGTRYDVLHAIALTSRGT